MSANDFYLDVSDIEELTEATIVARADDAQAWNPDTEEWISIQKYLMILNQKMVLIL